MLDDDLKNKLGITEQIFKFIPKAFVYNKGVFIIGFENNLMIKINIEDNTVRLSYFILYI